MPDTPEVKGYHRLRRLLGVVSSVVDVATLLVLLLTGWTLGLRDFAERWTTHPSLALLIYLLALGLISFVVSLPFDFFKGFWLEHRLKLSNLSFRAWVQDQVKGLGVSGLLSFLATQFVYATLRHWPEQWWIISGTAFMVFFVVLANLAPILILPLFFRFKPLENQALAERVLELSRRAGTRVRGVFEWKLSEKSKKANAALLGLGNTRRIILSDTLLETLNEDEVEAVVAHELGHHVRRHLLQKLALQAVTIFVGLYLADQALRRWDSPFGFRGLADFANLPLLILVGVAGSLILLPLVNIHSRTCERQADAYALEAIRERHAFVSALEKLAAMNLAERQPPAWIEFVFYSHPSVEKRTRFGQRT
jgi:STE24 endopeptidase